MKFKWKIFILCIGIYIITLFITGITITENTYNNSLKREVDRSIIEASSVKSSATLYLSVLQKQDDDTLTIKDFSENIIEVFGDNNRVFQIFGDSIEMLASNTEELILFNREDIKNVLKFKKDNYILKEINGKHYLFINSYTNINEESLVISYIKDLSFIDYEKDRQYSYFLVVGLVGLVIIMIVTSMLSKILLKPITKLSQTVKQISSGNYEQRVNVKSTDEIGEMAVEFNKMADTIQYQIMKLELESENKQIFIDDLTHEIRTPLTSIIGYADILRKMEYNKEKFDKSLGYIYSEGTRMLKLSKVLMKLILVREEELTLTEVNTKDLMGQVKEVLLIKATKKNITIEILPSNIKVEGDEELLFRLFTNLLDNAIKASFVDGKVEIGTEFIEGKKAIYVKDFGVGMESEQIKRIIEPFYRVDKSRSRKEGGAGLGLTICNEIVKKHSAQMQISSEIDKGTKICIIFN
ncbi:sensor histidine kinase [Clostridium grantii]|uniref:histidine kinase n=1 Tax=Clostridium grantii DSM 8605 TaxID=1121316 RepID=A0A1M5RJN2_9CLOT|nr:HAMP domain-containing sensor histidine kinase [Clostridium grantii]SHH26410.1 Signal transduction histidine kinase [Clostridium grantii DSM 8605]